MRAAVLTHWAAVPSPVTLGGTAGVPDVGHRYPLDSCKDITGTQPQRITIGTSPLVVGIECDPETLTAIEADADCVILWSRDGEQGNREQAADANTRGKMQALLSRRGMRPQEIETLLGTAPKQRREIAVDMIAAFRGADGDVQPGFA